MLRVVVLLSLMAFVVADASPLYFFFNKMAANGVYDSQTGTICIGACFIFVGSIAIVANIIGGALGTLANISGSMADIKYSGHHSLGPVIYLLVGILAIYGVGKRRHIYLLPLIICCIIIMIVCFIAVFACITLTWSPELLFGKLSVKQLYAKRKFTAAIAALLLIVVLLKAWFSYISYKCFKFIKRENARRE
ncbi:hypothetical protein QR680_015913 [Steinernema hermaphroditum]|uniref:Uncharacterized protein n=1 Tax=Steinernema hermaphroditum TaxID=289476 RepID=A0AA39H9D9_9BILA|nr:hypothetical protein QR680_015913 [Steinernema hermaphroditum]